MERTYAQRQMQKKAIESNVYQNRAKNEEEAVRLKRERA